MKTRTFGKKCKCDHFESGHANLNNKFHEPDTIPETRIFYPPPTIDNHKTIQCRGCTCDHFSPEKKDWKFWK